MIIPNYINFKAGLCTDMEYFRFSYAGKEGQVIKRKIPLKRSKGVHSFYAIKRPVDNLDPHKSFEFKIYDLFHNGVIEKETITEDPFDDIKIPSLTSWFEHTVKSNTHFRDYLSYCADSNLTDK